MAGTRQEGSGLVVSLPGPDMYQSPSESGSLPSPPQPLARLLSEQPPAPPHNSDLNTSGFPPLKAALAFSIQESRSGPLARAFQPHVQAALDTNLSSSALGLF
ncbi:hypothetical protein KIL84_005552 [Mauremys mutica]|uniref:Uncharacterized protein n=1 Tax=Mauremys mutica TaxID=74926 RepID=A0A9D4ALH8_9SAUR|nr:hypothetical protein KIL84_005552 [Mauremys mutica]